MAPASIIVRLTSQLVAGYQTYGFTADGRFPEVVDGILHDPQPDYPGSEFYIGGKIVKDMDEKCPQDVKKLAERGVMIDRDPRRLLATVADKFVGPAKKG